MRTFAIAVLLAASAVSEAASASEARIDLDRPGAMEAVEHSNPAHFAKIEQIRHIASRMPCNTAEFGRILNVRWEATEAACGVLLMTSYPSKRHLSFTLDDTRYSMYVRLNDTGYKFQPARQRNAD